MYFHKAQEKPPRWGSFADVQYAIRVNSEKIYGCNPDDDVLVMPLFWGLPCLDYSGYNNHGTNHGATYKDGSLDFDGADWISLGTPNSLQVQKNFTVCAWVNTNNLGSWGTIYGSYYNQGGFWFALQLDEQVSLYTKVGAEVSDSWNPVEAQCTIGEKCFICGTRNGATKSIYKDGSFSVSKTITDGDLSWTGITDTRIGSDQASSYDFNGIIDEVRIAKAARSADQIALFHERPWDLYRRVARPIWSIPAVGVTIPIFMQNMRGSFNSPGTRGGFIN